MNIRQYWRTESVSRKNAPRLLALGIAMKAMMKRTILWLTNLLSIVGRKPKLLHLCENLSLGERSSISVVQFEEQKFLVGVTAGSIAVLATLPGTPQAGTLDHKYLDPKALDDETPVWEWRNGDFERVSRSPCR